MARPAPIRLAGTIAATVMCVAAATEAAAQTPPQDNSIVLNNQLQLGDVFADQTLNVVDAQEQVTVATTAHGNSASGAVENGSVTVRSDQDMRGDAIATTSVTLGGDTAGPVAVSSDAGGNYLAVSGYAADVTVEAVQRNTGGLVGALTEVGDENARLLAGGVISATATSNTVSLYGEGSVVQGAVEQSSSATVRAYSRLESQYVPAAAEVQAQSMGNAIGVNSLQTSGQNLTFDQTSSGDYVEAEASANTGNGWDLAARARAVGNYANSYNSGGSVVTDSAQDNAAFIRSASTTTAYDYGRAQAYASGAGNQLSVGNNDIYVEIDSSQINTGGVEVTATFVGTNGYDVYVGAEATGNAVTGYACSECQGYLEARNTQTNSGDVSAQANTVVNGSGRSVISSTTATGNSATFYVSRPSH
ncbi:holdfast anchor protein HfaD [Brevundimonas sp. FT23028]|uniref:holdfast anchor protein HfaD n=1 Tax=Brevundimonas sp. FT23028 TaxID=3393748 RepID=UPI003B586DD7